MGKDEIITALNNALERGESLDDAARILINSGYNPRLVQECVNELRGVVGSFAIKESSYLTMPEPKSFGSLKIPEKPLGLPSQQKPSPRSFQQLSPKPRPQPSFQRTPQPQLTPQPLPLPSTLPTPQKPQQKESKEFFPAKPQVPKPPTHVLNIETKGKSKVSLPLDINSRMKETKEESETEKENLFTKYKTEIILGGVLLFLLIILILVIVFKNAIRNMLS